MTPNNKSMRMNSKNESSFNIISGDDAKPHVRKSMKAVSPMPKSPHNPIIGDINETELT